MNERSVITIQNTHRSNLINHLRYNRNFNPSQIDQELDQILETDNDPKNTYTEQESAPDNEELKEIIFKKKEKYIR